MNYRSVAWSLLAAISVGGVAMAITLLFLIRVQPELPTRVSPVVQVETVDPQTLHDIEALRRRVPRTPVFRVADYKED